MSLKPVFCKHKDLCDRKDKIDPYEVCDAAAKAIGEDNVVGAQPIDNLWKIYARNAESRTSLLSKGISVRGRYVSLFDSNPNDININDYLPTEKIIFRDLPLEMDNAEIASYLATRNIETTSDVKYGNVMLPTGKWSTYRNGDRYVYCRAPLHPVLPYVDYIGGYRCRISHQSQREICKSCRQLGHKWGDSVCPARLEPDSWHHSFRGYRNPLSNMFPCNIVYKGKRFKTVEHAFQWAKATALGEHNIAEYIRNSRHGGAAKGIADKNLSYDQSQEWSQSTDALNVMTELVDIKAKCSPRFFHELHGTKSANIVEATGDQYWACGIPNPKVAASTAKDYWQGNNILGAILMELRDTTLDDYEMLQKHQLDFNGYGRGISDSQDFLNDGYSEDREKESQQLGDLDTNLDIKDDSAFPALPSQSDDSNATCVEVIATPPDATTDTIDDSTIHDTDNGLPATNTELGNSTPAGVTTVPELQKSVPSKKTPKIKGLKVLPSSQLKISKFVRSTSKGKRKPSNTPPNTKDSKQRHVDDNDTDTDCFSGGTDEFHDTQSGDESET